MKIRRRGDENQKRAETNQRGPEATEDRPKLRTGNENTGDKIEYLTPDLTRGRKNEREHGFPNCAEKKRALRFLRPGGQTKNESDGRAARWLEQNRAMREQETNKNNSAKKKSSATVRPRVSGLGSRSRHRKMMIKSHENQ
jgi:hypothetical protein